jgi:hypothetical protein
MSAFTQFAYDSDSDGGAPSGVAKKKNKGGKASAADTQAAAEAAAKKKREQEELRALAFGGGGGKKKGKGAPAGGAAEEEPSPPTTAPVSSATGSTATAAPATNAAPTAAVEAAKKRAQERASAAYEEDLAAALRESILAAEQKAAAANGAKAAASGAGGKAARMSLGEFLASDSGASAGGQQGKAPAPKQPDLAAIEKRVQEQLAVEKFRESVALESQKKGAQAVTATIGTPASAGAGAGGGGAGKKKGKDKKAVDTDEAAGAGAGAATGVAAPPTFPGALPSPLTLEAESATPAGRQKLVQAYAFQTYELTRLQQENEALRRQISEQGARLAEADVKDRLALVAELNTARQALTEFGIEVARMHMEDQRKTSRIHELELALLSLRGSHGGHGQSLGQGQGPLGGVPLLPIAAPPGLGGHVAPPPGFTQHSHGHGHGHGHTGADGAGGGGGHKKH